MLYCSNVSKVGSYAARCSCQITHAPYSLVITQMELAIFRAKSLKIMFKTPIYCNSIPNVQLKLFLSHFNYSFCKKITFLAIFITKSDNFPHVVKIVHFPPKTKSLFWWTKIIFKVNKMIFVTFCIIVEN